MRNLLAGRSRSLISIISGAAGSTYNEEASHTVEFVDNVFSSADLMQTTGASTFDPVITRSGGSAPTWYFGDGNSDTNDSTSHDYSEEGLYSVRLSVPTPTSVITLNAQSDNVKRLTVPATWTNLTGINLQNNQITHASIPSALTALTSINLGGNSLSSFTTATWPAIQTLYLYSNSLTGLTTYANWTSLKNLRLDGNGSLSQANVNLRSEWVAMEYCYLQGNNWSSFSLPTTWTSMKYFDASDNNVSSINLPTAWTGLQHVFLQENVLTVCGVSNLFTALINLWINDNSLSTFTTYAAWVNIQRFRCQGNSLTTVLAHSAWTKCFEYLCNDNNLTATAIDNILIALDATGKTGGTLAYENNPGSSDGSRSGPGATAKANLISKSWVVTN